MQINLNSINTLKRSIRPLIKNFRNNRCHEVARHLRNGLTKIGYRRVVVKDGIATYEAEFWRKEFTKIVEDIKCRGQNLDPMFYETFRANRHSIYHSWIEIGDMIVDYHSTVRPSRESQFYFSHLLFITKRGRSDSLVRYDSCGKEFGFGKFRFIYSPGRVFPHIVKLLN